MRRCDKMKVFISWSGQKSQRVAEILKQWIPCVIQSVEPYFSSADIDKGARWSTDIAKELQNASFGILCVTKENLSSSWLNFEAGALSKSIEQSRVCPFLVDLKATDIQNSPILQFQMTSANKSDVKKLFVSINSNLGEDKLEDSVLKTTFDTFWPKINEALGSVNKDFGESEESTTKQDPIDEILELMRYQHRLLKNPIELFPPDYVMEVFRQAEKEIPRDYLFELEDRCRHIKITVSYIMYASSQENIDVCESAFFRENLLEINENAKRMSMLIRKCTRNRYYR